MKCVLKKQYEEKLQLQKRRLKEEKIMKFLSRPLIKSQSTAMKRKKRSGC